MRSLWSEAQSAPGLIFAECIELLHLWLQKYNQSDFGVDHLVMSMCSLLLCCWKRVFAMTSAFSWQNSVSFWPALFCTPRPNLPVTPGISWLSTFAFQSPIIKRTSFLVVSSTRSCRFHRTVQIQLLQRYWLGHRLGLPWYWMVCLGNEQRSFCCFWDYIQVLHFGLFLLTMMATPFLLRDSYPQ